jgi:hypothetical protein
MAGSMPPELRQMLENYSNQQSELGAVGMLLVRIFGLFVTLVIGAIFSTLGGVLGAAIFRKRLPPGTIDITPAP